MLQLMLACSDGAQTMRETLILVCTCILTTIVILFASAILWFLTGHNGQVPMFVFSCVILYIPIVFIIGPGGDCGGVMFQLIMVDSLCAMSRAIPHISECIQRITDKKS
jgi:hypothetical protein